MQEPLDGEAELSTPEKPGGSIADPSPSHKELITHLGPTLPSSLTLAAANSLINLINVISVGFGVGAHCSVDGAIQPEYLPPHSVLCDFSKAA